MTSDLTRDASNSVATRIHCTNSLYASPQSRTALSCMRKLPFHILLDATIADHDTKSITTDGDIYLPTVDRDFIPLPPSTLTRRAMFHRIPIIAGWAEDDATFFTPLTVVTETDIMVFLSAWWPGLSKRTVATLLSLYPTTDYVSRAAQSDHTGNLPVEFYHSAQLARDIVIVCSLPFRPRHGD